MSFLHVHEVVCAAFFAWFSLSVLHQVRLFSSKMGRFDPLGLLPRWTFFAPNPGIYDYHIVYREVNDGDGSDLNPDTSNSWRHIQIISETAAIPLLWNPERRIAKTISDISNSIIGMLREKIAPDVVPYTPSYFLMTHLAQRGVTRGSKIEWAIVKSHGFHGNRTFSPVFVSNVHEVA
jgi:hypothetical protein